MRNRLTISTSTRWYGLFSRGSRDLLRHNAKLREGVQRMLPEIIASTDVMTGPQQPLQIPVRLLEHARFRLSDMGGDAKNGVGQGSGHAGDVLRRGAQTPEEKSGQGNQVEGEIQLVLELSFDEVLDLLWEQLRLPDLQPRRKATLPEEEFQREGWDRHGAPSRLDRRRTVKEAIKRRAIQPGGSSFRNEDLRFKPLVERLKPITSAVVIFALDVSASMTEAERKLAKSFFFFALQGIRRKYASVEVRFVAHTTQAWEFPESEFFQVTGTGGTSASTVFKLALEMMHAEYDAAQYNSYLFYASDGENFSEDRQAATETLQQLNEVTNYIGYVETVPGLPSMSETEMRAICSHQQKKGAYIGTSILTNQEDVWNAIRKLLMQEIQFSEVS